jgi:2-keto-4-pentenoate hydratase
MTIPVQDLARRLLEAEQQRTPLPQLTIQYPALTATEAYAVQLAWVAAQKAAGASVVGKKIGLTSPKIQEMFGVKEPELGR